MMPDWLSKSLPPIVRAVLRQSSRGLAWTLQVRQTHRLVQHLLKLRLGATQRPRIVAFPAGQVLLEEEVI